MNERNFRPVTLIGAPTDVGANRVGARMGPQALRVAGLAQAVAAYGCSARDAGDLRGPDNPQTAVCNGYRHLAEVTAWCQAAYQAVGSVLAEGRLPLLLGGDHSLAIGSISAVAQHCRQQRKRLLVLWFDAHADFNTSAITPSGNLHGMPLACLCGIGPAELTSLSGQTPALAAQEARLIGVRSVDAGEKRLLVDAHMSVADMRYIDEVGMRSALDGALQNLDQHTHLHVSLDVDFLDPHIAPGVATPVRGGPTYREAQLCMEMIADTGCLASLDIVELNPALDHANATAELAVDLCESLFGKSTLARF